MASILDKYNEHLFLEHNSNKSSSFIANVNLIASKFNELVRIDEKFDAESIMLLIQLVQNSLDVNIRQIAEDLRKGSYNGYRKLDVNLLTNFADYDYNMTDEEKNTLWNDPTKQVYYSSIDVYFDDNTSITKEFTSVINNHHQLFSELDAWEEFKAQYEDTSFNISPDTPVFNHELLRITDSSRRGSSISKIVLHVASAGGNTAYDAVFAGAKSYAPEFAWMDTTSALVTIAHKVNDIIYTSDYVEQLGGDLLASFEDYLTSVENYVELTKTYSDAAAEYANEALAVLDRQRRFTVESTTLSSDADPTAQYDHVNNKIVFGLPRSEIAIVSLSKFAINAANGHLTFETVNDENVESVYINDDGNIIIEMKQE